MEIWLLDKNITAQAQDEIAALPSDGFLWVEATTKELNKVSALLERLTGVQLHERHLSDCRNKQHPSSFDFLRDYAILIFRSLIPSTAKLQINTTAAIFIITDRMLITLHHNNHHISAITKKIREEFRYLPEQPPILMYQILHSIVDNFLVIRKPMIEKFDDWQGLLLDEAKPFKDWNSFLVYKNDIRRLHIIAEEQLDAVSQWKQSLEFGLSDYFAVKIKDLQNHVRRVLRFSEQQESQLASLLQLHYSLVANRLNDIMRVLAVISGIFLPLTLLTGIFGMNFEFMPLIAHSHGYAILMGFMCMITVILLLIFRWAKWI